MGRGRVVESHYSCSPSLGGKGIFFFSLKAQLAFKDVHTQSYRLDHKPPSVIGQNTGSPIPQTLKTDGCPNKERPALGLYNPPCGETQWWRGKESTWGDSGERGWTGKWRRRRREVKRGNQMKGGEWKEVHCGVQAWVRDLTAFRIDQLGAIWSKGPDHKFAKKRTGWIVAHALSG